MRALSFVKVLKPEYLTLKKLIFDEITAKMVPEDIITRVIPLPPKIRLVSECLVTVHDSYHGRTQRIVADAKAVCAPSRCL